MDRDSAMPVKTEPPHFGCHPIESTEPAHAVSCIDRLLLAINAKDQTPFTRALHSRVMADDFTDMVGFCFRKLEISPWGDDERAAYAADWGHVTKTGD
jgi:hypothetical protein